MDTLRMVRVGAIQNKLKVQMIKKFEVVKFVHHASKSSDKIIAISLPEKH